MSYKIISQFIKDISFEIPDVQTFTLLEKEIKKPFFQVRKEFDYALIVGDEVVAKKSLNAALIGRGFIKS